MLIDSHCHLDYYTEAERPDVLARAAAAGVGEMVTIGTTLAQSQRLPAIAEAQPNLWCTVGIHPHHAAEEPVPTPEAIAALTGHPRVIGIGEFGPRLLLRPLAARRAAGRVSAPTSAPPDWPACRSPSTPATPTTTSPLSCRMNVIPGGTSASCCTASARRGRWPRRPSRWAAMSASPAS